MGEEKRHQMMQNLFGDQSEEEEEEEEVDSEHEVARQRDYISDEGEGGAELEGEGEAEIEGQGEAEVESDAELHDVDPDPGESEGERAQSSPEREVSDQREESEGKEVESDDQEEYGQRVVTSRRREVIDSESERSEENQYVDNEDEEVDQAARPSRSPSEEKDEGHISHSAAEIRDVFGDSDEDEPAEYTTQNDLEEESHRSPMEEESYEKDLRPEDIVPDEDAQYESEDNIEQKTKEKPLGNPLEVEIPLRPPPGLPDKMNMIKVSNIMGIEPKPFDPKTYVEEDMFVTDESGSKKRIRLENNIVRWRRVRNPDGTMSGILQSQGRLLRKMRFMPSSLSSNSHRLLTALVDSRHKKVYKVKNCITDIDPEREKEEKEKAESQTIRANELLHRKREKVNRKYTQTVEKGRQLSPGFLEEALDEDDEPDYYESRRSAARHRFEEDLEVEAQAEKRIMNAKRAHKDIPRKPSLPAVRSSRRPVEEFSESEREESEYESDGDEGERSPPRKRAEEPENGDEEDDEQEEEDTGANEASEEEDEELRRRGRESGSGFKRKEIESDGESPPRKATTHRRMAFVYDSDEE
ncbi:PREDICTED: protein LEO1 homolog isoform X2 [Nelumbo nucifera]|uniref:Protein LEO1 homolog isoform X2 n=1 Tax=Nelumbo nucifera TaxID=4432 RepID=A0A1U8Q3Q8_NELNU|nr:PREDICTED: protein LEO1 homolog isoform X2 [Nelumbo nucifera]